MADAVPHRRWNPLLEQWVLVSPHRATRPWQGAVESSNTVPLPEYDPACYLCPGNTRVQGSKNPSYEHVFVFDNDFPALLSHSSPEPFEAVHGVIRSEPVTGTARVICFSPRHDLTLPQLSVAHIVRVIDTWADEYQRAETNNALQHMMIFENKGAVMGCSNPHPHAQVWSTSSVPTLPATMIGAQERFFVAHSTPMLQEYLAWERTQRSRILAENDAWVALVPYWAAWPFEVLVAPRRQVSTIPELTADERMAWATILKQVTSAYDRLFGVSFPYSMGVYQAPLRQHPRADLSLVQVFFPPLLRSASVKKFMVGYEMCAETQRDILPEDAAKRLRDLISA